MSDSYNTLNEKDDRERINKIWYEISSKKKLSENYIRKLQHKV